MLFQFGLPPSDLVMLMLGPHRLVFHCLDLSFLVASNLNVLENQSAHDHSVIEELHQNNV